jgi:excisionase family DNA binding protein
MNETGTVYEWEESPLTRREEEAALTVAEVARRLGVHRNSVALMLRSGRLQGFRVGRYWRVQPAELRAFRLRGGTRVRGAGK